MRICLILLNLVFLSLSCKDDEISKVSAPSPVLQPVKSATKNFSYIALGDSYTVGQSVPQNESFPYLLYSSLKADNWSTSSLKVIARTGWTTDELQRAITSENLTSKYDIVTILIGVNNQYRGYSIENYRKEFAELLTTAISFAGGRKQSVFVLSIPDWGVTPYAASLDRSKIAAEIDAFNSVNKEETIKQGVSYLDITSISRNALNDPSLIANDGLHPSGKMYNLWIEQLAPLVKKSLGK